ncbi:Ankycorbin [Oopsacas minuta]|uniref:Ankycorbin n=1 Tax=Oopsacas minuta TaxID=111878 RepID=A0AAV7JWE5_9METZ|nr:Ankycorbin [Oopsacas minuta]
MLNLRVLSQEESVMQAIQARDVEALEHTVTTYGRVNIDFLSQDGITPLMEVIIAYAGTGGRGTVELKLLQALLQLNPNLSIRDSSEGRTAMHWAVVFDMKELLVRLIEMGADYTLVDLSGMNPIHLSIELNAEASIQIFLKFLNKDVFDLPDGLGRTCLIHAIQSEQALRTCQKLITAGVNVNLQESSKPFHTPLHAAALIDAKQIVDLLLKSGSDPSVVDDQGRIALHCAAMNPGGAVFPSLLKSTSTTLLDLPDKQGLTPFLLTARYAASKQLRLIVKKGANTSARNVQGQTGFHLLAQSSEGADPASCLSQLREKEPILMDSKEDTGHTPLTLAASVGNDVVLAELIRARADVNVVDGEGHMPLHWAAAGRNPLCVRMLIEYLKDTRGDLNPRDNRLATPLHYSVQLAAFTSGPGEGETESTRALECCHVLLEAGADPNAMDISHSPPILWAARYPHSLAVIRLLKLFGANISLQNETGLSALHLAAQEGLIETCRCLVEECAFPGSIVDNEGQTALFYALDRRNLECFRYLLSVGVYPDHQDLRDRSVAHLASVHGLIDYLRVLKEHKANLDLSTFEGIRPAHEAVVNMQIECLRYLLVHVHCSVNNKGGNGASLLHYAADKGSVEMCQFLLENGAEVNSILSHEDTTNAKSVYYTPVDFARMKGFDDVVSYLESLGGKGGEDVADKASRKIQKMLRRRVAESKRKRKQASTGTDTDIASSLSETGLTKGGEVCLLVDTDTTDEEDGSRSVLSPFHVPTPLKERKYFPGLHTISLATPPLKFTPAPQPSSMPILPIYPTDVSPQEQINARTLKKQLSVVQDARGPVIEEELSVSAVSYLAAGAVAVLSAALGGEVGQLGLEAAGAVMQGELDELRKDIQVQRQVGSKIYSDAQQSAAKEEKTPAVIEETKLLHTIQEHPIKDESDDDDENTRLEKMVKELAKFSTATPSPIDPNKSIGHHVMEEITRARNISFDANKKLEEVRVDILRKRVAKETQNKLAAMKEKASKEKEQYLKEFERLFSEANEVGKEVHDELVIARETNRKLEEFLASLGVTKKPTVAQWLERKREQKRLEVQKELTKWDNDKTQREAYVNAAKRMSEERIARHSNWSRQKELTLLNIREKQRLIELELGTSAGVDLFSRDIARNPYIYVPKSTRTPHTRPWTELPSYLTPKSSQRRTPATQPQNKSPRPPTKPRTVSRPFTFRMTERGLLRISDPPRSSDSSKSKKATTIDPTVANNPIWIRATGPKSTPKAPPLVQLRPEEYAKLEKFRRNLASFPISAVEKPILNRALSTQSI